MDKYIVLEIAGEGSYGTVAKCLDRTTERVVAIKKLRDPAKYYDMVVREISLLRAFRHDHVVPMVETFRQSDSVYIVFPYMQCNLYKYLYLNGGSFTVDETRKYVYQVLKGLDYVHNQNVIHRDIKPENILLSTEGIVKICDFGVSRFFCPTEGKLHLSTNMGTVWYQAPEMLMQWKHYGTEVDIWSVGILFTELINKFPLVTEKTSINQLLRIAEILKCKGGDLLAVDMYLYKMDVNMNFKHQQRSPSKSYTVANTALTLQKLYPQWPTHLLVVVANCLQFNSASRKNAAQLLDLEFFTDKNFSSDFDKELEIRIKNDKM